jgi:hypothetical protein
VTVRVLHQIGDRAQGHNFNTLEEILACNEPLHFDGVYRSVWGHHRELVGKGKDITFFVTGAYLGGTNAFDVGQPLSKFCTLRQVEAMATALGAKIGYHGKRHYSCSSLSPQGVQEEIEPPLWFRTCEHAKMVLAWPYGDATADALKIANRLGYEEAWSVAQAADESNPFFKRREHLNW